MWVLGLPMMVAVFAFFAFAPKLGLLGAAAVILLLWLAIGAVVWAGKRRP
jgi:hypothetical protein